MFSDIWLAKTSLIYQAMNKYVSAYLSLVILSLVILVQKNYFYNLSKNFFHFEIENIDDFYSFSITK